MTLRQIIHLRLFPKNPNEPCTQSSFRCIAIEQEQPNLNSYYLFAKSRREKSWRESKFIEGFAKKFLSFAKNFNYITAGRATLCFALYLLGLLDEYIYQPFFTSAFLKIRYQHRIKEQFDKQNDGRILYQ